MEIKILETEKYPENSIICDWKENPQLVADGFDRELANFGLKVIAYETGDDSYCFQIIKDTE